MLPEFSSAIDRGRSSILAQPGCTLAEVSAPVAVSLGAMPGRDNITTATVGCAIQAPGSTFYFLPSPLIWLLSVGLLKVLLLYIKEKDQWRNEASWQLLGEIIVSVGCFVGCEWLLKQLNEYFCTSEAKESKDATSLRTQLKSGYAARAVLPSISFIDHALPIQEVHFTIEEHNEEMSRQAILVADMFKPRSQPGEQGQPSAVHRILVLGQAGSGKTTLSKYIADAWANEKLWPQYQQVFWITLRDLYSAEKVNVTACAAYSSPLAKLIHQACFDEEQRSKIDIQAINQLLENQPRQTLLLLDGFDEVAQAFADNSDGTAKVIKKLLSAAFATNCDIIVTSRHYSLPPTKFDQRLVNQGFSDDQVRSYIQCYFTSLPSDKKMAGNVQEVQDWIKGNIRLWSHAHNPLILSLACDFYRDAEGHGRIKPENLTLLDLYERNLLIFMRRHLDRFKDKESKWSWERTKNRTLENLLAQCAAEVDFLQTLSFLGVKKGQQRFDQPLKNKALNEVSSRYPNASEDRLMHALEVGVLHEFPSAHASALYKTHEFTHLTFQEFFAARYLAERLQHHDAEAAERLQAYAWLRCNKYHPRYREVLNFLCAMMPVETYPTFWEVLLQEQHDIIGVGHLQLLLYSLEAVQCDKQIPKLSNHLDSIGKALLGYVTAGRFQYPGWLSRCLAHCPSVLNQLGEPFWDTLIGLLKSENEKTAKQAADLGNTLLQSTLPPSAESRHQLWAALLVAIADKDHSMRWSAQWALVSYARQAGRFSSSERHKLWVDLFAMLKDEDKYAREAALQVSYAWGAGQFSPEGRRKLWVDLFAMLNDEDKYAREAALQVLLPYAGRAGQFSLAEREKLSAALFAAVNDKNEDVRRAAYKALESYAGQIEWFLPDERQKLLDDLFAIVKDKDKEVRYTAYKALEVYAKQVGQFLPREREALSAILFAGVKDENGDVRYAVLWALEAYAKQAGQLLPAEREALLAVLIAMLKEAEDYGVQDALASYVEQAVQFSPAERATLSAALFAAVKDKNEDVRRAAWRVLISYANQAGQFLPREREALSAVLFAGVKDENGDVRYAAWALEAYAKQAGQLVPAEREALLAALIVMPKEVETGGVQAERLVLTSYARQAGQFSPAEREILSTALFVRAKSQEKDKLAFVANALAAYVEQAGQFSSEERRKLSAALFVAVKDKHVWGARDALVSYVHQAGQFSFEERQKLSAALFATAIDEDKDVRKAAWLALAFYAEQTGQFSLAEREALSAVLFAALKDEDRDVQEAAWRLLKSYAGQARQFSSEERQKLSAALFAAVKDKHVWRARDALVSYEKQVWEFSAADRTQLVRDLFELAQDKESRSDALIALNAMSLTRDDFLSEPFFEHYYQHKDSLSVDRELLLSATPFTDFLYAYLYDAADSPITLSSRRQLWLQVIVARSALDNISLVIATDQCQIQIYDANFSESLDIPLENRAQLILLLKAAFAKQATIMSFIQDGLNASAEINSTTIVKPQEAAESQQQLTSCSGLSCPSSIWTNYHSDSLELPPVTSSASHISPPFSGLAKMFRYTVGKIGIVYRGILNGDYPGIVEQGLFTALHLPQKIPPTPIAAIVDSSFPRKEESTSSQSMGKQTISSYSSFLQPLTGNEYLGVVVPYLTHCMRHYSPFSFPWNRLRSLTPEEDGQLRHYQIVLSRIKAIWTSQKKSTVAKSGIIKDELYAVQQLLVFLETNVGSVLKSGKTTTTAYGEIADCFQQLERLVKKNSQANHELRKIYKHVCTQANRKIRKKGKLSAEKQGIHIKHNVLSGQFTYKFLDLEEAAMPRLTNLSEDCTFRQSQNYSLSFLSTSGSVTSVEKQLMPVSKPKK